MIVGVADGRLLVELVETTSLFQMKGETKQVLVRVITLN
jgi:hypothetical protein